MSVLYALSGALVVFMCSIEQSIRHNTGSVMSVHCSSPLAHVVVWLVTYVTSYWLAGCTRHTDTSPQWVQQWVWSLTFDIVW